MAILCEEGSEDSQVIKEYPCVLGVTACSFWMGFQGWAYMRYSGIISSQFPKFI